MSSSIARLIYTEAKLFLREPVSVIFVLAFPALVVLVLGGVFEPDDPAFGGATPSDYYVAAYFGVVLAAVGFIMLPTHLASYRERGVLKRFQASHFPPWALPAAWITVAGLLSVAGFGILLATARAAYGVPTIERPATTLAAIAMATFTYLSVGIFLGLVVPTVRAAQGVGLALFVPSFLLGGAGPPPDAMPPAMRSISNALPMTHAVRAIQHPWLNIGSAGISGLVMLVVAAIATATWLYLANRTES